MCSQSLSPVLRKEKQKPAKSLSFPYSLIFYKSHWEINIATRSSSSSLYPQKSLLRIRWLINFKIKTDVAGRMIYGLPHTLQFLHSGRGLGFFILFHCPPSIIQQLLLPNLDRKGDGNNTRPKTTSMRRVKHYCNVMETARDLNWWLQFPGAKEEGKKLCGKEGGERKTQISSHPLVESQ